MIGLRTPKLKSIQLISIFVLNLKLSYNRHFLNQEDQVCALLYLHEALQMWHCKTTA